MMHKRLPWRTVLRATMLSALLLSAATTGAAAVTWVAKGPFETCLEGSLENWLAKQAERELSEETSIMGLDDATVAKWTVSVLQMCAEKGRPASPTSEDVFAKHMARWREHVHGLASELRRKGGSD